MDYFARATWVLVERDKVLRAWTDGRMDGWMHEQADARMKGHRIEDRCYILTAALCCFTVGHWGIAQIPRAFLHYPALQSFDHFK